MEPTGFLVIRTGVGSRAPGLGGDTPPAAGCSIRLGWVQGVPYIVDPGGVEPVRVNSAPITPQQALILHPGDTVSLGDAELTWQSAEERVTGILSREALQDRSAAPSGPPDGPAGAPPALETSAAAKPPSGPARTPGADVTMMISRAPRPRPAAAPEPDRQPEAVAAGGPVTRSAQDTAPADMGRIIAEKDDAAWIADTPSRDRRTPCLVIHTADRTWEVPLSTELVTIGRGEENDVDIADPFVSRCHATVEQRAGGFTIRETQSRNGVWLGRQRVQEHTLRDGDVVHLGGASLVFKAGFRPDDLTLVGAPRIDGESRRRPVVVVPGLMGSELWLGSERIWPNPRYILSNPELLCLPGDPRIEARGIVNEVVIVPNLVKQRQYSALGDYLVTGLGYTRGKDLMEFAYDWRQDVRLSAQRLAEAIGQWKVTPPVTIMAHSLGTLVTRYYVERLGGKDVVERVILMGGPHHGTPKGLSAILVGPGMLPFHIGAERMRAVLSTFPSAYQILPVYPCVSDQEGTIIDALEDRSWLPEPQRPFLRAARAFRRELGLTSSVPAVSVFGYGFKTILRVKIDRRSDGQWHGAEFVEDSAGDSSVPAGSAVLKGSEIHPVAQDHGALYVDDDVRMRLKVELCRSTTWQRRKY